MSWVCRTCTFNGNEPNATKCSMCQSPRPAAAAQPAAPAQPVAMAQPVVQSTQPASAPQPRASAPQPRASAPQPRPPRGVPEETQELYPEEEEDPEQYSMHDDLPRPFESFYDITEENIEQMHKEFNGLLRMIPSQQSLVEALKAMNPDMVAEPATSICCIGNTVVLEGSIGLATKFGETYFLPPGNYWWKGVGVEVSSVQQIENIAVAGTTLSHLDITYINVSESNVAVAQVGRKQYIIGSGRYILKQPATLMNNRINIQELKNQVWVETAKEIQGKAKPGQDRRDVEDRVVKQRLKAGEHETCGAVTFVRSEPGFCWVVQNVYGQLRTGIGMTVCRGGERFLQFIDRQNYARTTRTFYFESKDRQEVRVRVQLKWRLENAKMWMQRKGASEDIFDAIEEITESLLRDAIASMSYEECRVEMANGFEQMESTVASPLEHEARQLGGNLIGFEIRALRFPLLDDRNRIRAELETRISDSILEEKRQLQINMENWKRQDADLLYTQREEKQKVVHDTKMQVLKDQEALKKMEAKARLDMAKQQFLIDKQLLTLTQEKSQLELEIATEEARVKSEIKRALVDATGKADATIALAVAKADMIRMAGNAEASSKVNMAEAEAKAADILGASYNDNEAYLQLQLSRMNADLQEERAKEIAEAMKRNGLCMLPPDLQDEITEIAEVKME